MKKTPHKGGIVEETERHLRESEIVSREPIFAGTSYSGRAEAEFANFVSEEEGENGSA
jgi:hypothetical protein